MLTLKEGFNPAIIHDILVKVVIDSQFGTLEARDKELINKLIAVLKLTDLIFLQQKNIDNLKLLEEVKKTGNRDLELFFKTMAGPYNCFDSNHSYLQGIEDNPHAAFYPQDLSRGEWEEFLQHNQYL